jgi:glycosyltransferase involved in cell wall biosynthesis
MKLWLLLSRFENGGLERVQANLAPAFEQSGIETWLVAGKFLKDAEAMLPNGISTLELSPTGKLMFIFNLYCQLQIHQPDVIMTTSNDVSCLVLILRKLFFPKTKVICTQHLSISTPLKHAKGIQKLKYFLILKAMQWLWPKSDAIIAVSSALAKDVHESVMLKNSISTIYNPIVLPNYSTLIEQKITQPWADKNICTFVFVGRLAKVKRVDLLLQAFKQVQQKHLCRLMIVGDGTEKEFILDFIRQNYLTDVCHLTGQQNNPLPWIKYADALVLPSDYEGFGNVIVEAMACRTQVIATDCPFGPAEILDNGRYGQLVSVDDKEALAEAMKKVINRRFHVPKDELQKRANEFSLESAVQQYLNVINTVMDR